MGGVIQSIFGGGQQSMPELPETTPAPTLESEKEPVAKSVRDTEQRRIRSRRAMNGTLLTGGQNNDKLGILGRNLE